LGQLAIEPSHFHSALHHPHTDFQKFQRKKKPGGVVVVVVVVAVVPLRLLLLS
jgi:hypothetical protein